MSKIDSEEKRKKARARQKKYRDSKKTKGLGDVIEKITVATGIKKLVDSVFDDCGCEENKALANVLFPSPKTQVRNCMTEDQYKVFKHYYNRNQLDSRIQRMVIAKMHSSIFGHNYYSPCTCSPKIWRTWLEDLRKVYDVYNTALKNS